MPEWTCAPESNGEAHLRLRAVTGGAAVAVLGDEVMATILEMRSPARRSATTKSSHGVAGPAEIVFFPGVRYERWSDDEQISSDKPVKSKKRRDTITVDE